MKKYSEKLIAYLKQHRKALFTGLVVLLFCFLIVGCLVSCKGLWSVGLEPSADNNTIVFTDYKGGTKSPLGEKK